MTRNELDKEIEFIHSHRTNQRLLRSLDVMRKVIINATNTYTNLLLFMNDTVGFYEDKIINKYTFNTTMNDIYLLALIHTSCEEEIKND